MRWGRRAVIVLAVVATVGVPAAVAPAAWAHAPRRLGYVGAAPGSVTCAASTTITFSPPLTQSGGGTHPSRASGRLGDCTTSDGDVHITSGSITGSFAPSTAPGCTTLAALTTSSTFTVTWRGQFTGSVDGTDYAGKASFTPSVVTSTAERIGINVGAADGFFLPADVPGSYATGSFGGATEEAGYTSLSETVLGAMCDTPATGGTGRGVATLTVTSTITIGTPAGVTLGDVQGIATDGQLSYCALLSTGGVDCWGDNTDGQLGNGTTANSSVALPVTEITSASSVVSDGQDSYCALLSTGGVDCWGDNAVGELGDGTTTSSPTPVAVSGTTTATALTSDGEGSYCAILASGQIECWGYNTWGELGDGTMVDSPVPVPVTGITTAASVVSDSQNSYCAVLVSGTVACWGYNGFGELGDGARTTSSVPVAVTGITTATAIASDGEDSYCAVLTSGGVECWGANFAGELGDGTTTNSSVPVSVSGITTATVLADDGTESYCAVLASGQVACWGYNGFGELGNGTTTSSSVPVVVSSITTASAVESDGSDSFCAVLSSGAMACWGANVAGELGDDTTTSSSVPVSVSGVSDAVVASGGHHGSTQDERSYCAALSSGAVECWGSNTFGELGNGTTIDSWVPVTVVRP